ncbi:MAG: 2,6-dihydroxypyridine 3-monooxygenase [Mycobacterium sp.]|jgi:2,6-dihydroxypyridine 3-monooxygenase|uniref:FAD binding domain-containing protein n=1 Tax=Mycobacterium sp. TaxID=1785 RepID=UPI0028B2719B|nr:FAD-dependent monooxygenase [Mycobacterium sp.]MDT5116564.1 2,6-dihydroxypyridine 3-monooxygenase [Mycobacterium sp.]
MNRAVVVGGSLGGLTAALVLRDRGWDVDVLERSAVPLEGRGAGIVAHPSTIRYLVERAGRAIGDIGVSAGRLRYIGDDGAIADERPCAYRFASYFELYRGLLDAFGVEHYHLSTELVHLENRGDEVAVSLTDGRTLTADLVVCADGIRSTGRRILVPHNEPRYAGYVAWRGTIDRDQLSARTADVLRDAVTYRILPRGHLLTYPIPGPDGSVLCNWLWYRNVAEGEHLATLLTDRHGSRAELTVPPGAVQTQHVEQLHSAADTELPAPLAEVVRQSADPFIQVIVDLGVPQLAFGRTCLIGDAAFALRPHIAAGTAKAADDAWQLGEALLGATPRHVPLRLKSWEARQLPVARRAMQRARVAGRSLQIDGTWRVGDPAPFGLRVAGDSTLPAGEDHNGDTDGHVGAAVSAGWLTRFRKRNSR